MWFIVVVKFIEPQSRSWICKYQLAECQIHNPLSVPMMLIWPGVESVQLLRQSATQTFTFLHTLHPQIVPFMSILIEPACNSTKLIVGTPNAFVKDD